MNDTKIIFHSISVSIPDDHPIIYQYISGDKRGKVKAVNAILELFNGILSPPYSHGHIRTVARSFLKIKEKQYKKGEIKIKPIYK